MIGDEGVEADDGGGFAPEFVFEGGAVTFEADEVEAEGAAGGGIEVGGGDEEGVEGAFGFEGHADGAGGVEVRFGVVVGGPVELEGGQYPAFFGVEIEP